MKKVFNKIQQPKEKRQRYWQKDTERAYYHLIAKVVENTPGNFAYAFNDTQKQKLEQMLWRLDSVYLTEVVSYCIMSNHIHIVLMHDNKADEKLSMKEAALRYQNYYKLAEMPDARSTEVSHFRKRINNVSEFMRDLQRQFTWWYNHKQGINRKGSLWNKGFINVTLKSRKAFVECMKYVELNAVRGKMVHTPGDYRFSSWGHIVKNDGIGKKLQSRVIAHLRYMMGEEASLQSDREVFLGYAGDLEALGILVAENKDIKHIDPYTRTYLLAQCEHWTRLKIISGEDTLVGVGHGGRRPRTVDFKAPEQE